MEKISIGVIGCGAVAENIHLPTAMNIPRIKIESIADLNRKHAEDVAAKIGLENVTIYTDYIELLKEADVDAVWIFTPPSLHARMIVDALNHKKSVLCEKPLATTAEELEIIERTLKKKAVKEELILMPAHNFIFTPCYSQAFKLACEGEIGRIERISGYAVSNLSFYKAKTDFRSRSKGGVIEDQLPHVIYLSQDIAGPTVKVESIKPRSKGYAVTQDVKVNVKFKSGADGDLSAGWKGTIPTLKFNVIGEEGIISMDILRAPYSLTIIKKGEKEKIHLGRRFTQYIDVLRGKHPSYLNEQKHFVDLMLGETEQRVTVKSGFELVRTLDNILKKLDERTTHRNEVPKVSIIRVKDDVGEAVQKSITLLGGIRIRRGSEVIIKPNICSKKNTENMVTTDPRVLEAIIKMVKKRTDRIVVVESDNISGEAEKRAERTGILEVIDRYDAEFMNLSRDETVEQQIAGLTVRIPKTIMEADYLINTPKIKTCNIENLMISIAMKNMFGVIADRKKTIFHKRLTDILLYLNRTIKQKLIVVDGVTAMEGLGPVWGTPVHLNLIISGLNPVTVDTVCCNIMEINPYTVEVLWRAYKMGMGEINIERIKILGERIEDVHKRFAHPRFMAKNLIGAIRTLFKTYI